MIRFSPLLLVIPFLLFVVKGVAQDSDENPYSLVSPAEVSKKSGYETETVDVKNFDDKLWNEIVNGKSYSESGPAKKKKDSQGNSVSNKPSKDKRPRRTKNTDSDDAEDARSSGGAITSPIFTIIVYVFALAIIAYLIFFILKNISIRPRDKIAGNLEKARTPTFIEDIKDLEIDRLSAEALASSNYRLAVRIYFLGLLQQLDEDGFIDWKKDKTNNDYLSELCLKTHHFEDIKNLTIAYEQVWYGDHDLPATTYEKIISLFKGLVQKLKAPNVR
jgi:hypothetical protein